MHRPPDAAHCRNRPTWRFFADTRASYKRVLADAEFNGYNTVFTGYPKLDDYKEIVKRENDAGRRKKVIYAPHHSLGVSNNLATFDLYKDKFLALVKKYPEIDFVLKPHTRLQKSGNCQGTACGTSI